MSIASASLSSSAFFTPTLFALNQTNKQLAASTQRLSTGNRIINVGDDVAAYSIASRLQSQIVGLKQASKNAVQGDSLLQVAQGGLQQILELLDRQSAIATQANVSSLTSSERSYLQAEFSQLSSEIDRIAGNTKFNNIQLLDGTLSGENKPTTTTTAATKASATLTFTGAANGSDVIKINGVNFTEGAGFTAGATAESTVDSLLAAIAASTETRITQATYTKSGTNAIIITNKSGGKLGNQFTIDKASYTGTLVSSGGATQSANITTLTGGLDNGLNISSTKASGTIGDAIVNTQSQTSGSVTLNLSGAVTNVDTLSIDNGNGGTQTFTFSNAASTATEIQIGSTTEETLQNIVNKLTQYSATNNFGTRQLDFRINGDSLIISGKTPGNPGDFNGAVLDITESIANGTLSATTITGGTNTGVNVSGVNNGDFVGTITGFSATYVGADSVNVSLTVGNSTYTASITDTTPNSNTTYRFSSANGGYFDVQLAADNGYAVSDSTTATTYAGRLSAAFEGLTFYQARNISNFSATGTFVGASAKLQRSDFTDNRIDSIKVTAPASAGQDATIDVSINGKIYRASSGIGGSLGKFETLQFVNTENANDVLSLTNGSTVQDFSTGTLAATFEANLRSAFGLDSSGSGVTFQIGASSSDTLNVVVNTATTEKLFNGTTPDVSTQVNAASAQTAITTARTSILTTLSKVGAYQERLQSAQTTNDKSIEGISNAYSNLADTDIAEESTLYATAALKLNAGISVLAQTRNLQSSLLTVLQAGNR